MSHSEDNKRIAKNTIYLYLRSLFTMVVSLYTSRLILEVLGFTDHGIYNLIGSVVVMFNMFSSTFVASTQRFLNFALGKNDPGDAAKVFSASINIHVALCILIVFLLETIGLWFLNYQLNIPDDRLLAANIVYQWSILTFAANLMCIPYSATIIAKEKMQIFAIVSVYESVAKLIVVLLISIIYADRLIIYGGLLAVIPLSTLCFYYFYCGRNYMECEYTRKVEKTLYKEMVSISGWNFLGSSASILTVSGMGIVLNMFTNVIVNSAKGIAAQVETVVKQLVDNFMTSLRPQITKSFASGDFEYLAALMCRGTKISLYLMCVLCYPVILNVNYILELWLGNVPLYTDRFVQMTLLYILMIPFSNLLDNLLMASGKIKQSQILLSVIQLMNLPLSCLILYLGFPPYFIYFSYIFLSYVSLTVRIFYSHKYACLDVISYVKECLLRLFLFAMVSIIVSYLIINNILVESCFFQLVINCVFIETILTALFIVVGFNKKERVMCLDFLKTKILKI